MFTDPDRVKVHKLTKKEQGQYPGILTEQAWLSYLAFGTTFLVEHTQVVPSKQESAILSARVANQSTGFGSSCPLTDLAI